MDDEPLTDSQIELERCIDEIEKTVLVLADDNAEASRSLLERLRQAKDMLPQCVRTTVRMAVLVLLHELMAEVAKRIIEASTRTFPMPFGGVKVYGSWGDHPVPTRVSGASAAGASCSRRDFAVTALAA